LIKSSHFDPRDVDSRDDERHPDARSRGGQRGSSDHGRDDNSSQPETRTRDRHDDAGQSDAALANNRQESDQEGRNRDGDPRWADRDRMIENAIARSRMHSRATFIRHEPDNRFLECALAADAEFIVTVNTAPGHFDRKQYQAVTVHGQANS
jgi:hypothetical protein